MKIIDVHSHFVCPEYMEYLKKYGKEKEDGFPTPSWSIEKHLAYMDRVGIENCLLSLSSPHFDCGNENETVLLAQKIDEYACECKIKYPNSFLVAASLPVPYMEASVRYVKYAYDVLNVDAVKLPSNASGMYLGNKAYEPLFDELNQRSAIVLIHPTAPQTFPEGCFTSEVLPLFEFIADTTRSIVDLLVSGMVEKYPNIKFIVPHCGSFLPNIIDRIEGITKVLKNPVQVKNSLSSFYFDIAGNALPSNLKILLTLTDENHILFGGDFPYTPIEQIEKTVNNLKNNEEIYSILYKNAEKLLFGYKKNKK